MPSLFVKPTIEDLDNILTAFDVYTHLLMTTPADDSENEPIHRQALGEALTDISRLASEFNLDDIRSGFAENPHIAYPRELRPSNINNILRMVEVSRGASVAKVAERELADS